MAGARQGNTTSEQWTEVFTPGAAVQFEMRFEMSGNWVYIVLSEGLREDELARFVAELKERLRDAMQ